MDKAKLKIIGISGTNGSGKDTLGHILSEDYGYLFVSVTELLREECMRRGLKVERKNLRVISAEWRREHGLGVLVDKAVDEFKKAEKEYRGVAMASLRNPGEADRIHALNGTVIWLDADPKNRYQRIVRSSEHRSHRAHEDTKTYEEFLAEEDAEMYRNGDEATLDMAGVKQLSDIFIDNSGEKTNEFKKQVEEILGL